MFKNYYFKKLNTILSILVIYSFTTIMNAEEIDPLASITTDLKHFSDIATQTKQNEHYQPYIISVFQGKDLEKLGVSNLKEALSLVPGVDMAMDNFNNQIPIFRGSNPLASGQSKLLIDDILVNDLFFDGYSVYLSIPIQMIKRIEVVRGPGSKTNGINAYSGSIHVITYAEDIQGFKQKDKIVLKGGSYQYAMAGFIKAYKQKDLKIFTDFFYQKDNKELKSGKDALAQGVFSIDPVNNRGLSRSGDAPLGFENYSLGITLNYKDFSIKARTFNNTQETAYGYLKILPEEKKRIKLPNHYLELGYEKRFNDIKVDIKAGVKYDSFDYNSKVAPDGFELYPGLVFNDGMYGDYYTRQQTLYQSSFLEYTGIKKHKLTIGYKFVEEKTVDMHYKFSNLSTGDAALVDYTDTRPFFDKNAKRDRYILSFQDEYKYNNKINFIYGFNYEETSLQDAGMEPRASMVYQADSKNIYKFMYSKSHRNPSWQEMYSINNHVLQSNKDLNPEKVDAFEMAYIRKFSNLSHLQINFFYLLNKDQIYQTSAHPDYGNIKDTDIYGTEIEYKTNITNDDQAYINYSFVDGKTNNESYLANVAKHMIKAYYIYNLKSSISLSTVAKYVSSKKREAEDTRDELDGYATVDTSIYYKNKKQNYSLIFSVKNIFNTTVKLPSQYRTYEDDYTQEGRNFLISFTKEF